MARIYARPADGLSLLLPDGRPWPPGGEWVDTADQFVRRRIADMDIVEIEPPAEAAEIVEVAVAADGDAPTAAVEATPAESAATSGATTRTKRSTAA